MPNASLCDHHFFFCLQGRECIDDKLSTERLWDREGHPTLFYSSSFVNSHPTYLTEWQSHFLPLDGKRLRPFLTSRRYVFHNPSFNLRSHNEWPPFYFSILFLLSNLQPDCIRIISFYSYYFYKILES